MEKARRRHVPAFGEWNYDCVELPVAGQYTQEGSEVWFKSSPPQRKPTKKVRREGVLEKQYREEHGRRRQARVSDAEAHAPRKARVIKAVDADLYQVPPDMISQKPRKRMGRSLWVGCLGLNCVA